MPRVAECSPHRLLFGSCPRFNGTVQNPLARPTDLPNSYQAAGPPTKKCEVGSGRVSLSANRTSVATENACSSIPSTPGKTRDPTPPTHSASLKLVFQPFESVDVAGGKIAKMVVQVIEKGGKECENKVRKPLGNITNQQGVQAKPVSKVVAPAWNRSTTPSKMPTPSRAPPAAPRPTPFPLQELTSMMKQTIELAMSHGCVPLQAENERLRLQLADHQAKCDMNLEQCVSQDAVPSPTLEKSPPGNVVESEVQTTVNDNALKEEATHEIHGIEASTTGRRGEEVSLKDEVLREHEGLIKKLQSEIVQMAEKLGRTEVALERSRLETVLLESAMQITLQAHHDVEERANVVPNPFDAEGITAELGEELNLSRLQAKEAGTKLAQAQQEIQQLEFSIAEATTREERARQESMEAQLRMEALGKRSEEVQAAFAKSRQEIEHLLSKGASSESKGMLVDSLRLQVADLSHQLQQSKDEAAANSFEVHQLLCTVEQKSLELQRVEGLLNGATENLNTIMQQTNERQATLNSQIAELSDRLQEARDAEGSSNLEVLHLRCAMEHKASELARMEGVLVEKNEELDAITHRAAAAQAELRQMQSEVAQSKELENNNKLLEMRIEELLADRDAQLSTPDDYEETLYEKMTMIDDLRAQISRDHEAQEVRAAERDATISTLRNTTNDLTKELQDSRCAMATARQEWQVTKNDLTRELQELRSAMATARKEWQAEMTQKDDQIHSLVLELDHRKSAMARMEAEDAQSLRTQALESESRCREASEMVTAKEKSLADKCAENDHLARQLHARTADLQAKESHILNLQQKLEVGSREMHELQQQGQRVIDELKVTQEQLRDCKQDMDRMRRKFQSEMETAQTQAQDHLMQELSRVQNQLLIKHETTLKDERQLREDLERQLRQYQTEASSLQSGERALKIQIADLESDRDTRLQAESQLDAQLKHQVEQSKILEETVRRREEEIREHQAQSMRSMKKMQDMMAEKEKRVQSVDRTCHDLQDAMQQKAKDVSALQVQVIELNTQVDNNKHEISKRDREISRQASDMQSLLGQIDRLQRDLNEKVGGLQNSDQQIKTLHQQLEDAIADLRAAKESCSQREQFNKSLQSQIDDFESQWNKLNGELVAKDRELAVHRVEQQKASTAVEQLTMSVDRKEQQRARLQQQLNEATQRLQGSTTERAKVQDALQDAERKLIESVAELTSMKQILAERDSELQVLSAHAADMERLKTEAEQSSKLSLEQMASEVTWMKQEVALNQNLLRQKDTEQMSRNDMENELHCAKQTIRSLKESQAAKEGELKQLQSKLLNTEGDNKRSEVEKHQEVDALILELSAKEQELMKLHLETVELRGQVRGLQFELKGTHFAQSIQQLETQVSELASQLQAANLDIGTKETELQTLNQEVEEMVAELQRVREVVSQREAEVLLLSSEIQSISNKASERVTRDLDLYQASQATVKELEVLLGEATQELTQLKDEFSTNSARWSQTLMDMQQEIECKEAQLKHKDQIMENQERQLRELQSRACELAQPVQSMQGTSHEAMCNNLIQKIAASPIPVKITNSNSKHSALAMYCTPAPSNRADISPTRVGWSPERPSDEEVLSLPASPPVPFTSISPVRPPRLTAYLGADVQHASELLFTIGLITSASTHWSRLKKCRRGTRGIERYKLNGPTAQNRTLAHLSHPRLHADIMRGQQKWQTLCQWFACKHATRKAAHEKRRGEPVQPVPEKADLCGFAQLEQDCNAPLPQTTPAPADGLHLLSNMCQVQARDDDFLELGGDFDLSAVLLRENNKPGFPESA